MRIAPHLGSLPWLKATYPHPQGVIAVEYVKKGDALEAKVKLPGTLTGSFEYGGRIWKLEPGENRIEALPK